MIVFILLHEFDARRLFCEREKIYFVCEHSETVKVEISILLQYADLHHKTYVEVNNTKKENHIQIDMTFETLETACICKTT